MTVATVASQAQAGDGGVRSAEARSMLETLLDTEPVTRWEWFGDLDDKDRRALFVASRQELGSAYALWQDDAAAFNSMVLNLTMWSLQRKIAVRSMQVRRLVVPSCTTVGKTLIAAAKVLHHGSVWPVGTARAVTTATRMSQVRALLWPEIKMLHGRAGLPGTMDEVQWKIPTGRGDEFRVAYGLSAPKTDPVAVSGIHAPHLLIVIDEAGGIARTLGDAFNALVTGLDTRLLAIGNPDPDDENTWMEEMTGHDDVETIVIDALRSPNFTGETVARCRSCPDYVAAHSAADHLLTRADARLVETDHGKDAPYYQAKVRARFPKGGPSRVLPMTWLDAAAELAGLPSGHPVLIDDPKTGRPYAYQPAPGSWVRLGVDVAADGGDELAIARIEGNVGRIVHAEAGPFLANAVDVAGRVLTQIREAQNVAHVLGSGAKVRVKVDGIGVGWGVCGILEAWGSEGLHDAEIVPVIVSESVEEGREEDHTTLRPRIKRDEMWLAMRAELAPDENGEQTYVLDIDNKTKAQLGAPRMGTRTDGTTFIEPKKSIRRRGLKSPDRGEALLLGVYEPEDLDKPAGRRVIRTGA